MRLLANLLRISGRRRFLPTESSSLVHKPQLRSTCTEGVCCCGFPTEEVSSSNRAEVRTEVAHSAVDVESKKMLVGMLRILRRRRFWRRAKSLSLAHEPQLRAERTGVV